MYVYIYIYIYRKIGLHISHDSVEQLKPLPSKKLGNLLSFSNIIGYR